MKSKFTITRRAFIHLGGLAAAGTLSVFFLRSSVKASVYPIKTIALRPVGGEMHPSPSVISFCEKQRYKSAADAVRAAAHRKGGKVEAYRF
ncbi:MAG TPA: hypothetical protein PKE26_10420 [Kiritimatiellia bacterium]|nr:hypothetical protein [Kiritimatiellia bacterium]HMO99511.1 hypothetical protein [Kiritimatiellia bacterium]HMP91020.1 hypothetical protein [Kiritimatiellia bacterium]